MHRSGQTAGFGTGTVKPYMLVIEPSLTRMAGHAYNSVCGIEKVARESGFRTSVLISHKAPPDFLPNHDVKRIFRRNLYQRPRMPGARGFHRLRNSFYRSLSSYLANSVQMPDCLVLRTASQEMVAAIADLIEAGLLPASVNIVLWLLFEPGWNMPDGERYHQAHAREYRTAFQRLEAALANGAAQVGVFAELQCTADRFSSLLKRDIKVGEPPDVSTLDLAPATPRTAGLVPRVMMLGCAALDKGYELLPDAMRILRDRGVGAEFKIHAASEPARMEDDDAILNNLRKALPNGMFSSKSLSEHEYFQWLSQADLLVLPYRLPDYARRGSGIYLEASRLGIPMVVPERAEFAADALAQARAVPLADHTSLALADAIETAVGKWSELKAAALQTARAVNASDANQELGRLFASIRPGQPGIRVQRTLTQRLRGLRFRLRR